MRPSAKESTIAYAARLREKAHGCEFGETHDAHIFQTITNKSLIQRSLEKKWNLTQFLTAAGEMEDIALQIGEMGAAASEDVSVGKVKKHRRRYTPRPLQQQEEAEPCTYCGQVGTHAPGENCPSYTGRDADAAIDLTTSQ